MDNSKENLIKKIFLTIVQIIIAILSLYLTKSSIEYSTALRGYTAIGGEYFIPFFGIILILILEKSKEEN